MAQLQNRLVNLFRKFVANTALSSLIDFLQIQSHSMSMDRCNFTVVQQLMNFPLRQAAKRALKRLKFSQQKKRRKVQKPLRKHENIGEDSSNNDGSGSSIDNPEENHHDIESLPPPPPSEHDSNSTPAFDNVESVSDSTTKNKISVFSDESFEQSQTELNTEMEMDVPNEKDSTDDNQLSTNYDQSPEQPLTESNNEIEMDAPIEKNSSDSIKGPNDTAVENHLPVPERSQTESSNEMKMETPNEKQPPDNTENAIDTTTNQLPVNLNPLPEQIKTDPGNEIESLNKKDPPVNMVNTIDTASADQMPVNSNSLTDGTIRFQMSAPNAENPTITREFTVNGHIVKVKVTAPNN